MEAGDFPFLMGEKPFSIHMSELKPKLCMHVFLYSGYISYLNAYICTYLNIYIYTHFIYCKYLHGLATTRKCVSERSYKNIKFELITSMEGMTLSLNLKLKICFVHLELVYLFYINKKSKVASTAAAFNLYYWTKERE